MRLARDEGSFADAAFDTVYLGGGTPSLAPPEELGRLLAGARTLLGARPDAWITLEANPEQVTTAACAAWRDLGIAAVSLGVQSFWAGDTPRSRVPTPPAPRWPPASRGSRST